MELASALNLMELYLGLERRRIIVSNFIEFQVCLFNFKQRHLPELALRKLNTNNVKNIEESSSGESSDYTINRK